MTSAHLGTVVLEVMEAEFEISELRASISDRRLDARWQRRNAEAPIWINARELEQNVPPEIRDELMRYRRYRQERQRFGSGFFWIAARTFEVTGLDSYCGVFCQGAARLLPSTELSKFLVGKDWQSNPREAVPFLIYLDALQPLAVYRPGHLASIRAEIEYSFRESLARFEDRVQIDSVGFLTAVAKTEARLSIFDPWSWQRSDVDLD